MEIIDIDVNNIIPNPNQPRKEFDKGKLQELADSIKSNGLINPIQVKQLGNKYQLICGERRLKAHKLAKINTIKSIVKTYANKKDEMVESLIENLQRANLNSVEKENYITLLWKTGNYKTKEALGKALGISDSNISLNLIAEEIRKKTNVSKKISTRVISDVRKILDTTDKKRVFQKVLDKELNSNKVREYSNVVANSPIEVKEALLNNNISLTQAENISKIPDEKIRIKLIKAHKEIKTIDDGIDNFTPRKKDNSNVLKTKELINQFRENSFEAQKITQTTIKSLMKCMSLLNMMDDKQLTQLERYQKLFETNLNNILDLLESLKQRVLEIK